jgi:hypothetical protein
MIDWSVVKQAGDAAGRAYQRAVSEPYESAFDRHVKTQLEPLRRYLGSSDFLGKLEKLIHDTHGKLLVTRPDDRDALQKVRRAWEVVRGLRFGTKKPEALTHSELAALAPFLPDDVASPEMRQLLESWLSVSSMVRLRLRLPRNRNPRALAMCFGSAIWRSQQVSFGFCWVGS